MGSFVRTHCRRGHEYNDVNTYIVPSTGFKECRLCIKIRNDSWGKKNPEYPASRRFGGNREKAIKRDGEQCVKCKMTREDHKSKYGRDITVDHINGLGRYTPNEERDNRLENLQTLCLPCHGFKDASRRITNPVREELKEDK